MFFRKGKTSQFAEWVYIFCARGTILAKNMDKDSSADVKQYNINTSGVLRVHSDLCRYQKEMN